MKHNAFLFLLFIFGSFFFFAETAGAKTAAHRATAGTANTTLRQRLVTSELSSTNHTWVGFASDQTVVWTASPAISALFSLGDQVALQTYATVFQSSPFNFGVGGNIKVNVIGDLMKGFHVGGGLGLGQVANTTASAAASSFFININGILGFHFHLIDRILFSVDGGAHVSIANGNTNFTLTGDSALLGLSILYRL